MSSPEFYCWTKPVHELEPGDVYATGTVGGGLESRRVLGVLQLVTGGAFLEVVDPLGDVFKSTVYGRVAIVEGVTA